MAVPFFDDDDQPPQLHPQDAQHPHPQAAGDEPAVREVDVKSVTLVLDDVDNGDVN